MDDEPEEEGDFRPMFEVPDFAPNFPCRCQVRMDFDVIGFSYAVGAPWSISPSKDILSCELGDFPFEHFIMPGSQIHMRVQVHAFPIKVPVPPCVFWRIILPIINYFCQARMCGLGADTLSPVLVVQNWPLLPGIVPE
jgi:hypothetical protein